MHMKRRKHDQEQGADRKNKNKNEWLALRDHLLISPPHLDDLRGQQPSAASPSVQYVCGDKDEN